MNRIPDIMMLDTYGQLTVKEKQYHTQQHGIYTNNPQFKIFRILFIIRF